MSEFNQIRAEFNRAVAMGGWVKPEHCAGQWPVPVDKWLARYYRPLEIDLARQRRLVNHFTIGADPEFIFEAKDGADRQYVHACDAANFKAGFPYGADNNGRLMEIRPRPAKFVLETLGSIWATLKWMSLMHPETLKLSWRPGAYYDKDGLGGHVHFGRRRHTRPREMAALDTMSFWLFQSGIWDGVEGKKRVQNAYGGGIQGYGRLGDVRKQPYGYEYRTFPSWMCSPWMAYLSMTLAKLAVFDPQLFPVMRPEMDGQPAAEILSKLTAILAYYKGRDDDAALALAVLSRQGWPKWHVNDFKNYWGIVGGGKVPVPKPDVQVLPTSIAALPAELDALRISMLNGRPPEIVSLEPSWKPTHLPTGYLPMIDQVETRHAPGVGELCADLCSHTDMRLVLQWQNDLNPIIQLPNTLTSQLRESHRAELKARFPNLRVEFYTPAARKNGLVYVYVNKFHCAPENRRVMREFLLTYLPIWRNRDVSEQSWLAYRAKWFLKPGEKAAEPKAKLPGPQVSQLMKVEGPKREPVVAPAMKLDWDFKPMRYKPIDNNKPEVR